MQQQQANQQNMSQQQAIFQQPPAIVTTKDSLYLADMMSWNLLATKKAHFFAQQCQDQEIKQAIDKVGQMHQRHYEKILSHCISSSNQQQAPLQ